MMSRLPARRPPQTFEGDDAHIGEKIERIKIVIAGTNPATQAAALADLVALFLAGQHPHLREQLLLHHVTTVRELVPPNEAKLFADTGYPAGWPR